MLKAVTFDLWQTLLLDTAEGLRRAREGRVRGIHDLLFREGLVRDVATVGQAYDAVGVRLEEIWATRRDVGSRGQVRLVLEILGVDAWSALEDRARAADQVDDRHVRTLRAQFAEQIAVEGVRVADIHHDEIDTLRCVVVQTAVVARRAKRRASELTEAGADRLPHQVIGTDD